MSTSHVACPISASCNVCSCPVSIIEGSFEVKLPRIGEMKRQGWEESERRRKEVRRSEKESEERRCRCGRRWESRNSLRFSNDVWLWRVERRLDKAAGAEPSGQMRDEKLHAIVAQSTCPNQNVQSTTFSDHFWKLSCLKSARHCGPKHVST